MNAVVETLPEARFTESTIERMHDLVWRAKTDWQFQGLASDITKVCPQKDYSCEADRILEFVKRFIRYCRDPQHVELLQTPWRTLERRAGDCDDSSILIGAIAGAVGFPYRFITIKADKGRPEQWSHVYAKIEIPKRGWVGMDASVSHSYVGWEPTRYFERAEWPEPARD